MDQQVADLNTEFADATVFQSQYSLEANLALDLQFKSPVIITNAADPEIFNPSRRVPFSRDRKIRLISTSWSTNPNKGGATYKELETLFDWDRIEYTFVGRTEVQFDQIHTSPGAVTRPGGPAPSARRLHHCKPARSVLKRSHDALTCGLPVIYVNSGAHSELVADADYPFSDVSEIPDLLDQLVDEYEMRQSHIRLPLLDHIADEYLRAMQIAN